MNVKHVKSVATPSMLLLIFLIGLPQIGETIYSPALPSIAHSLYTSNTLVQWTLSVFFFGFAFGVLFWGRLSDHIGRRSSMLLGLLVFAIGSLLCLVATNIYWLLIARVIQAFGGSAGSVVTQAMMREAFEGPKKGKVFSLVSISFSFVPAIGPVIGGYLSQYLGWRANFAALLLSAILLIIYAFMSLPETLPKSVRQQQNDIDLLKLIKRCLCDKTVLGAIWLVGVANGIMFSYYAEAPFVFIKLVGISPSLYGWLGVFISSAVFIGASMSHRLNHIFTAYQLIKMGIVISLVSATILFALSYFVIQDHITTVAIAVPCFMLPMAGIILGGFGLVVPNILSCALDQYQDVLGTAGAIMGGAYYILISICTYVMGLIHTGGLMPLPAYSFALVVSMAIAFYFCITQA